MNVRALLSWRASRAAAGRQGRERRLCEAVNPAVLTALGADSQLFLLLQVLPSETVSHTNLPPDLRGAQKNDARRSARQSTPQSLWDRCWLVLRSLAQKVQLQQGCFACAQQQMQSKQVPCH